MIPEHATGYSYCIDDMSVANSYANITFIDSIYTNYNDSELLSKISIEKNLISVESVEDLQIQANLSFFSTGITKNVAAFHNGWMCHDCEIEQYGTDDYSLLTSSFSAWSLDELQFNGTFQNTTVNGSNLIKLPDAAFYFSGNSQIMGVDVLENSAFQELGNTIGAVTYRPDSGVNSTGSYWFDGSSQQINFPALSRYGTELQDEFTVAGYLYFNDSTGSVQTIFGYSGGAADKNFELRIDNSDRFKISITNGSDQHQFTNGAATVNHTWQFFSARYRASDGNITINLGGNEVSQISTVPLIMTNKQLYLGAFSGGGNWFNGSLEEIYIFPEYLSDEQLDHIQGINTPLLYKSGNSTYTTEVYNATDYDPETQVNTWHNITIEASPPGSATVTGRAAECADIASQPFSSSTQAGSIFTFDSVLTGGCFQSRITFDEITNQSLTVSNYTVESYKYTIPIGSGSSVLPLEPLTTEQIDGAITFLLNDTETGHINFTWYVDGINVFNNSFTGLSNGSVSTSNLGSDFTQVSSQVYFEAILHNGPAVSETYTSKTVIVVAAPPATTSGSSRSFSFSTSVEEEEEDVEVVEEEAIYTQLVSFFDENTGLADEVEEFVESATSKFDDFISKIDMFYGTLLILSLMFLLGGAYYIFPSDDD
jgi:hypothetical protein